MDFKLQESHSKIILGLMTAVYILVFFAHCYLRFMAFGYYDWDLAHYDQIIWNLSHGEFFCSLLGVNFLGHHAHFLAFPIAVIYKLVPHPLTLLFLQTVALGIAAVPLFLLARKVLNSRWALLVSVAYLLYYGVGYANIYEFHFTSFAPLILFSMFYFFFTGRHACFLIFSALALLCQENFALFIFTFGLYALMIRRSLRWWLPLLISSAAYFILCIKVLLPSLNPGTIQFSSIYSYWGGSYGEIICNLLFHPIAAIQYMLSLNKMLWLWNIFAPLSFVSLLSPGHLLIAGPLFLQRLLSNRQQEIMFNLHYLSEILPFVFLAFVFGLKRMLAWPFWGSRKLALAFIVIASSMYYALVLSPHFVLFSSTRTRVMDDDRIKEEWARSVPPDSSVVASFELLSHLSHRKDLYSFKNIYAGRSILSKKKYSLDARVDRALIDFNDPFLVDSFYNYYGYKKTQEFLTSQKLYVKDAVNSMVYFSRDGQDQKTLYKVLESPPKIPYPLDISIDNAVKLKGYDIRQNGDRLELIFFWQAAERPSYDLSMVFYIKDSAGAVLERIPSPLCYRIYPTQAWEKNTWVADYKYLLIPSDALKRDFNIYIGFYKMDKVESLPYFRLGGLKKR
jgi:uncharacterized membrane protein